MKNEYDIKKNQIVFWEQDEKEVKGKVKGYDESKDSFKIISEGSTKFVEASSIYLKPDSKKEVIDESKLEEGISDSDFNDFYSSVVPFGYLDIKMALELVQDAYGIRSPGSKLGEIVEEWQESIGDDSLDNIDVIALVYEQALQEARNEIDDKTGFDLINDSEASTPIYTAGNYIGTSYDRSDDAIEELQRVIEENGLSLRDFDESTQWFLEALDAKF